MIVSCTPYPSRYAEIPDPVELVPAAGRMYLLFSVDNVVGGTMKRIAHAISGVVGLRPSYHHERGKQPYYTVGTWLVYGGSVTSPTFTMEDMSVVLKALDVVANLGLHLEGNFEIRLIPDQMDMTVVFNAYIILEARAVLLQKALALAEPPIFIIHEHPAFSIPLDAFDLPAIEACICLYQQLIATAGTTKKARMQPCDMSNPKYYMRTWLLRLGFIGPQFECARRTLLANLDGNSAFYTEDNRKEALDKARTKRRKAVARTLLKG